MGPASLKEDVASPPRDGASSETEGQRALAGGPTLDPGQLGDAGLSPREIEVLELASRGLITDGIGLELEISPRTVQKHLEHVHEKLGVGTRMAAVARAYALSQPQG